MRTVRVVGLVLLTQLLATTAGLGQRRARGIYLNAGSLTTVADLNAAGTDFLSGGLYVGAGVSWQPIAVDSSLTVLGNVTWIRHTLHTSQAGSGANVDAFFYGLDLDYIYYARRRFAFTLAGGGGAVVLHVWDTKGVSRARPYARLGLGARYAATKRLQYFLQTFGIVYDLRNFPATSVLGPYHRRQSDVGIGLGVALRL